MISFYSGIIQSLLRHGKILTCRKKYLTKLSFKSIPLYWPTKLYGENGIGTKLEATQSFSNFDFMSWDWSVEEGDKENGKMVPMVHILTLTKKLARKPLRGQT